VRGRLWRTSIPNLAPETRERIVKELIDARRDVGAALRENDVMAAKSARARVHAAKLALGERGPVRCDDGAPDYNRHLLKNTPYTQ
jgi:hypothetical protein